MLKTQLLSTYKKVAVDYAHVCLFVANFSGGLAMKSYDTKVTTQVHYLESDSKVSPAVEGSLLLFGSGMSVDFNSCLRGLSIDPPEVGIALSYGVP